jgi:hypothetical protein
MNKVHFNITVYLYLPRDLFPGLLDISITYVSLTPAPSCPFTGLLTQLTEELGEPEDDQCHRQCRRYHNG